MMSLEQIVSLSDDQAKLAKKFGYTPYPLKSLDVDTIKRFPFPNIGSYRPAGWELVDYKTCDKTGMGSEYEPTLTVRGLLQWIKDCQQENKDYGMAIIEEGEFQVVIGLFTKEGTK
jgi:hypothetical protein